MGIHITLFEGGKITTSVHYYIKNYIKWGCGQGLMILMLWIIMIIIFIHETLRFIVLVSPKSLTIDWY